MDPLIIIIGLGVALSAAAVYILVLSKNNAELSTTLKFEREATGEKLQLLEDKKEELRMLFENSANKILDSKSKQLSGQHEEKLKTILDPLKDQLGKFKDKVEDVYIKEGKERASLQKEIQHLTELNNRISEEANNLTHALKGESKTRGNWGEMVLERVLEQSGLKNGREYETQVHLKEKYGGLQGRFPDVIVHLPEDRDVIIDAKVALNAYERHVNAEEDDVKATALKEHVGAVRNHMKELSAKRYAELEGVNSMELVLMCVPNESAFVTAVSEDPSLHDEAMKNKVVLVGPTTLLLTLKIVEAMWRTEYQNRNAMEIANRGQLLYEKFVGFVEDMNKIDASLVNARNAHDKAMNKLSAGTGNLANQAQMLIKLGVKASKKLPDKMIDQADESDSET